jgi:single-stranded DNA-binding protein
MRNSAEIQLIGYVYQDARCPNEQAYPNWVVFKLCVNKKYKDKNGEEQQDTSWFECKSSSENMSKLIKLYVKDKMGLFVRGIPKAKAYTTSSGTAEANIEVLVTEFNILTLTYPKEKTDTTEQSNGRYKIESGAKKAMPEAEIYDDEIPF